MMHKNANKATKLMWLILLSSIVRKIEVPDGDQIIVGGFYEAPFTVNDFIYFLGTDIMWLIGTYIFWILTGRMIAYLLVGLAIGKVLDEFVHPFGYWYGEGLWDILVIVATLRKWKSQKDN